MNNKSTRSAHFLLMGLLLLGLAACSSGGGSDSDGPTDVTANFAGTWLMESISLEGGPTATDVFGRIDLQSDGQAYSVLFSDDDDTFGWLISTDWSKMKFFADGTYSDESLLTGETDSGTWTSTSTTFTITSADTASATFRLHEAGNPTDVASTYAGSYSLSSFVYEDAITPPSTLTTTGSLIIDGGLYTLEFGTSGASVASLLGEIVMHSRGSARGPVLISNPNAASYEEAIGIGYWSWNSASSELTLDVFWDTEQARETTVWTPTSG